jgi:hypothetical protein
MGKNNANMNETETELEENLSGPRQNFKIGSTKINQHTPESSGPLE